MALKKTNTKLVAAAPKSAPKKDRLDGDAALAADVEAYAKILADIKAATALLDEAKARINASAFSTWLKEKGRADGVAFDAPTASLLVNCKNQYSAVPEAELDGIVAVIGEPNADRLFQYSESIEVDLANIPEDRREDWVAAVQKATTDLGLNDSVVTLKRSIQPTPDFHDLRHHILTEDQNRALNQKVKTVLAISQVKIKEADKAE